MGKFKDLSIQHIELGFNNPYIEIIDNFIAIDEQESILDQFSSSVIPYRFYPTHIHHPLDGPIGDLLHNGGISDSVQLSHFLMMHGEENASPHFKKIKPLVAALVKKFGYITLFRAKVNITFCNPPYMNYQPQMPHTDLQYENGDKIPHLVCLYYINDSDGPTYFFDKNMNIIQEVHPKQGRVILFDGSQLHAASNPKTNPLRMVININFRQGVNQVP